MSNEQIFTLFKNINSIRELVRKHVLVQEKNKNKDLVDFREKEQNENKIYYEHRERDKNMNQKNCLLEILINF